MVDALVAKLSNLENVDIRLEQEVQSAQSVALEYDIGAESVIWAAPGGQENYTASTLSIFAIGYLDKQVQDVKVGYGTLIPDINLPISGILHESDLHHSKRCPEGHRLFRLMVPHSRWDKDEQKVLDVAEKLLAKDPVLFVKIGERKIPRYLPGYMANLKQLSSDFSHAGWAISGVSITHVVDEAERFAELFYAAAMLSNFLLTSLLSPSTQSSLSLRHLITVNSSPPNSMKCSLIPMANSSSVSNPSARNAGATIANFFTPRLTNSSTLFIVDGSNHFTGPILL